MSGLPRGADIAPRANAAGDTSSTSANTTAVVYPVFIMKIPVDGRQSRDLRRNLKRT
jgi:hypothetical protein